MPKQTAGSSLTVDDFIGDERIQTCLKKLHGKFNSATGQPLIVSDTLDVHGNQYVNLVQKGGGVLGIALVGYTYILEEMGIRFLRLAGTSAGAINTGLMTVIGNKEDAKSKKVLDYMCNLNFFSLVDGHPAARWLIKNFITNKEFSVRMQNWVFGIVLTIALLLLGDFVFLGLQTKYESLAFFTGLFFVLTGFFLLLLLVLVVYIRTLLKRLKDSGFGINPGDFFYDWIKTRLRENGVNTVTELNKKAGAPIPGLHLRTEHPEGIKGLDGDVTFIASEIVTQNKIQLPKMCHLFRLKNDIDQLQPAGFIRASMAIPVFFESYYINNIPCTTDEMRASWREFNEPDPPETARFVDGGILSNFPIDIFYKPEIAVPRLPVFGIDLDDSKPDDKRKNAAGWSFAGYFGRVFNTVRFYYDKDFLIKNKMFEKGIGKIPLSKYNWLNFFLKPNEMKDMFAIGAEAATNFLMAFNWEEYKAARSHYRDKIKETQSSSQ
jgi:NTE family protein